MSAIDTVVQPVIQSVISPVMAGGGAVNFYGEADAASLINETDGLGRWVSVAPVTWESSAVDPYDGSWCLHFEGNLNGARASLDFGHAGNPVPLDEGQDYEMSIFLKYTAGSVNLPIGLGLNSADTVTVPIVTLLTTATTWVEYTKTFTYSASGVRYLVVRQSGAGTTGAKIDAIKLTKV